MATRIGCDSGLPRVCFRQPGTFKNTNHPPRPAADKTCFVLYCPKNCRTGTYLVLWTTGATCASGWSTGPQLAARVRLFDGDDLGASRMNRVSTGCRRCFDFIPRVRCVGSGSCFLCNRSALRRRARGCSSASECFVPSFLPSMLGRDRKMMPLPRPEAIPRLLKATLAKHRRRYVASQKELR